MKEYTVSITLNEAIEALEAGKKVSRRHWSDNDYYEKRPHPKSGDTLVAFIRLGKKPNFRCALLDDNNYRIIEVNGLIN